MKLTLADKKAGNWAGWEGELPRFDIEEMRKKTKASPEWVHFGAGNIFRGFVSSNHQKLLEAGKASTGIIAVETFDYEIIEKIYEPFDNLTLNVTALSDGKLEKEILAGIAEALTGDFSNAVHKARLEEIFTHKDLKMVSFTITEKGYALTDGKGDLLNIVKEDMERGPEGARHVMAILTALMYKRFKAGELPVALVSMDNCSHNGEKLQNAVLQMTEEWEKRGLTEPAFTAYMKNGSKVSFPWSMIDRITPRPNEGIKELLEKEGWEDMDVVITGKSTYIAPFVNAEETRYLFIEDSFPNGKLPLDETDGIWYTDRETVNKVETMKVTTCLNPLHTAIACIGSLLNYTLVSKAVQDKDIDKLIHLIGYEEGLPVVTDPGIIKPRDFLDQVYLKRFPNPYIPDAPQRIATDTSMKVGIRFGETIKSYVAASDKDASSLVGIPLAIAGWFRYLLAVDEEGKPMDVSSDPRKDEIQSRLNMAEPFGKPADLNEFLTSKEIFGSDLVAAGLGEKIQGYFEEMCAGPGAVREVLKKYL